jgi:hypothetical protein
MQKKWYLGTLLIILAVLGVVNQQQISVPNQEIVVQFADARIASNNAQNAIALVKEELQELGAENIRVVKSQEGYLKITYFSATDVAAIKKTLAKRNTLRPEEDFKHDKHPEDFPFQDNPISYNIDVYEIEKDASNDWDFNDTFVLELKPKSDRFFNPNVLASFKESDITDRSNSIEVSLNVYKHIATSVNSRFYNIPEVRAGPNC